MLKEIKDCLIKAIFIIMVFCFSISLLIVGIKYKSLYSETMIVKDIDYNNGLYTITFQSGNGNIFYYTTDDGDINENEVYACLMDSKYTKLVKDDKIREIKYSNFSLSE